jgi:ABC-type amino acid transport substrate-binding protein
MRRPPIKTPIGLAVVLVLLSVVFLTACGGPKYVHLTMDNLKNKRIGVMCGYSSDYIFYDTELKEFGMQLYRFDYYADMQLALRFNRLDAAAMESDEAYVFCRIEPKFGIALVPAPDLEFGYPFNSENREFLDQFNVWVREFRKTEVYTDIIQRVDASLQAPYVARNIPNLVTTDRVLRIAAFDGWEPVSYINASSGEWEGSDVELVTHFANSLGAKVEIIDMSYQQMLIELSLGSVDLMLCPETLLYQKDMEMTKNITMSDGVFLKSIVLIVNKPEVN